MPGIPVTFCADNDSNGVGIRYAEESAEIMGNNVQAIMPEFTDRDFAVFRQKHGPEAIPSDFNDLAQTRGLEAVKTIVEQHQVLREATQEQAPAQPPEQQPAPDSVFGAQEINRIEPDLEQVIEQAPVADPIQPVQQPVVASDRQAQSIEQPDASLADTALPTGSEPLAAEAAQKSPYWIWPIRPRLMGWKFGICLWMASMSMSIMG